MADQKQWWAPVWKGLAVDAAGRHYRKMNISVWLFLYLVINADRKTGLLLRKVKTISADMGITRGTAMRWLDILREGGYIATRSTGRCLNIQINKWRGPDVGRMQHQKWHLPNTRSWIHATSEKLTDSDSLAKMNEKNNNDHSPIDISIKKDSYKDDIDKGKYCQSNHNSYKVFKPGSEKQLLAMDLADTLGDRDNLPLYLSYAKRYPEQLLRSVLGEVKEVPLNKIKKSRGALFNHLVQKYAKQASNNSRD